MRALLVLIATCIAACPAWPQTGQWTLVQSVGDVTVEEPGLHKIAVKPNARINEGATVTTGPGARAILTDGRSAITVNASSRIELPAANDENVTTIRQDFGSALFKVQKKPTAHFEVQTPYLAAVVKGTTFEVTVDAMGATVEVEEGLVDVGANLSGERTMVPGGQRVRVLRSGRFDGGRPAGLDRGRETFAGLNVIAVEITPEDTREPVGTQEFAALDPRLESREAFDAPEVHDRQQESDGDRNRPEAVEGPSPPETIDTTPPPPEPEPVTHDVGNSGNGSAGTADRDSDRDDDRYDRNRWALFWQKLKQAYAEYKSRHDRD